MIRVYIFSEGPKMQQGFLSNMYQSYSFQMLNIFLSTILVES